MRWLLIDIRRVISRPFAVLYRVRKKLENCLCAYSLRFRIDALQLHGQSSQIAH
jgi:hypothetical protein